MPVSPQAQQMSQLQQQMQQAQMQQMLGPLIQKLMASQALGTPQGAQMAPPGQSPISPQAAMSPGGQGAVMGGLNAMGRQGQGPPTLGVNQPIPMQMPDADPMGQKQGTPLPPNPTDMQQ